MELNKIAAELEFAASRIVEIDFSNPFTELPDDLEIAYRMDFESGVCDTEEEHLGKLVMTIEIKMISDDKKEGYLKLVIEGMFCTKASVDKEKFFYLLNINGSSALYSVARAKIEQITAAAFVNGKILIPMVNMMEFVHEKYANNKKINVKKEHSQQKSSKPKS